MQKILPFGTVKKGLVGCSLQEGLRFRSIREMVQAHEELKHCYQLAASRLALWTASAMLAITEQELRQAAQLTSKQVSPLNGPCQRVLMDDHILSPNCLFACKRHFITLVSVCMLVPCHHWLRELTVSNIDPKSVAFLLCVHSDMLEGSWRVEALFMDWRSTTWDNSKAWSVLSAAQAALHCDRDQEEFSCWHVVTNVWLQEFALQCVALGREARAQQQGRANAAARLQEAAAAAGPQNPPPSPGISTGDSFNGDETHEPDQTAEQLGEPHGNDGKLAPNDPTQLVCQGSVGKHISPATRQKYGRARRKTRLEVNTGLPLFSHDLESF